MIVTLIKVYEATTDKEQGKYFADASELGLAPGYPPVAIPTDIGNGKPFVLEYASKNRFHYKQPDTFEELYVFND
jgi:hypothetical protein